MVSLYLPQDWLGVLGIADRQLAWFTCPNWLTRDLSDEDEFDVACANILQNIAKNAPA